MLESGVAVHARVWCCEFHTVVIRPETSPNSPTGVYWRFRPREVQKESDKSAKRVEKIGARKVQEESDKSSKRVILDSFRGLVAAKFSAPEALGGSFFALFGAFWA